ncbi:zinc finger BED domain-containing protein RICESLEEPER 2-like [Prosopis cineraria]|uniref:zinc finger BED domain-containing protein RICESLEEPER 2-like n=1 Tax=Prosopis cineraria TaxID=364024 RepID=UPI00240EDC20|nr:zinc finger BED domain-containing protein RICESLEEPER 2-like [Prosopis cineraria]
MDSSRHGVVQLQSGLESHDSRRHKRLTTCLPLHCREPQNQAKDDAEPEIDRVSLRRPTTNTNSKSSTQVAHKPQSSATHSVAHKPQPSLVGHSQRCRPKSSSQNRVHRRLLKFGFHFLQFHFQVRTLTQVLQFQVGYSSSVFTFCRQPLAASQNRVYSSSASTVPLPLFQQETYMELMDVHDDDEQPKNNKPELINNAHVTMDSNQQKEKEKEQQNDQEQEKDKGEKQPENSKVTGKRKPTRPESWKKDARNLVLEIQILNNLNFPSNQKKKEEGEGCGTSLKGVTFDLNSCRQALARMIIVDELPFKFVENEGFQYFMSIAQPLFPLPSRTTVARDCLSLYLSEQAKLRNVFCKSKQSVCLTTDCWTSLQNMNYLCLTGHFIDDEWKLHKRILNFCQIADHKGETIGELIEKCLLSWGIDRVFTVTVDNASSNDTAISYVKDRILDWNGHIMKGEYMHVRCCAHILNLVVNDGLKEIGDTLTRIRNAVRYIRASPLRFQKFKSCVEQTRIQEKDIVKLDCPTRWNSTYMMLESALKFQKAFKRLEEKDTTFAIDKEGPPTIKDWENARVFVKFLKIFFDVTKKVSGSLYVTSSQYFHEFCLVVKTLNDMCLSDDPLLNSMARKMKQKHDKYWGNVDNLNMMIFIAVVLDPRYKLKFVEWSLKKLYDEDMAEYFTRQVKELLFKMYDRYKSFHGLKKSSTNTQSQFDKVMNEDDNVENQSELDLYLMETREKTNPKFDILNWWKVNSSKYPVIGQIARDVLAMPISTVASESAFSTGGRILNEYRCSLGIKTVEALICANNWFQSTPLASDVEEKRSEIAEESFANTVESNAGFVDFVTCDPPTFAKNCNLSDIYSSVIATSATSSASPAPRTSSTSLCSLAPSTRKSSALSFSRHFTIFREDAGRRLGLGSELQMISWMLKRSFFWGFLDGDAWFGNQQHKHSLPLPLQDHKRCHLSGSSCTYYLPVGVFNDDLLNHDSSNELIWKVDVFNTKLLQQLMIFIDLLLHILVLDHLPFEWPQQRDDNSSDL